MNDRLRELRSKARPVQALGLPEVRQKLLEADLVFGFDTSKPEHFAIFFDKGVASDPAPEVLKVIGFSYDARAQELELLAAAVLAIKGRCDYEGSPPGPEAQQLATGARRALRMGDRAAASRMALESLQVLDAAEGAYQQRSDVLNSLAATFRGLDDLDRSEAAARAAIAVEEKCDRPAILGNHRMFYAQLLFQRARFEEAATMGAAAIPCYEQAMGADHPETQRVRAEVERFVNARPTSR